MTGLDICDKLEQYRSRLQDLSMRNPLLNCRDTKSSTLRLHEPTAGELWSYLVEGGKSLIFPVPTKHDEIDETKAVAQRTTHHDVPISEGFPQKNASSRKTWSKIETDKTPVMRHRALRNLSKKARTSIEEQGINILYVAFGFIKWKESVDSDDIRRAPLVLVPVSLYAPNVASPYILSVTDDDVVTNPTIEYLLRTSYGITLPAFDGSDLRGYLLAVRDAISRQSGWSVTADVVINTFQFQKLSMYYDLEARKKQIVSHPIASAIMGDSSLLPEFDVSGIMSVDHDELMPNELLEVVDADSSQEDAILLANNGVSFVLQGPPGTGKSQTITNIIASLIGHGKKVLFVSEKKAALDVVFDRLKSVGLDEFCLVMHGTKAAKRAILDQLEVTLELASHPSTLSARRLSNDMRAFVSDRKAINNYVHQVFTPTTLLKLRVFDANGEISLLDAQGVPDVKFAIEHPAKYTREMFEDDVRAIEDYALFKSYVAFEDYKNPWIGSTVREVTNAFRTDAQSKLQAFEESTAKLGALVRQFQDEYALGVEDAPLSLHKFNDLLRILSEDFVAPRQWATSFDEQVLNRRCVKELKVTRSRSEAHASASAVAERLGANHPAVSLQVGYSDWLALQDPGAIISIIDCIVDGDACYSSWRNYGAEFLNDTLSSLRSLMSSYHDARNTLLDEWDRDILELDFKPMELRFKFDYLSFFGRLFGPYNSDCRTLMALKKNLSGKLSYEECLCVLAQLRAISDAKNDILQHEDLFVQVFGELWHGEHTSVDAIQAKIDSFIELRNLRESLQGISDANAFRAKREELLSSTYGSLYQGWETSWDIDVPAAISWVARVRRAAADCKVTSFSALAPLLDNPAAKQGISKRAGELFSALEEFYSGFAWLQSLFAGRAWLEQMTISQLGTMAHKCSADFGALEDWVDYSRHLDKCKGMGLADCISALDRSSIPREQYADAFKKRFYQLWIDEATRSLPEVRGFRTSAENDLITRFVESDGKSFAMSQAQIKKRLIDSLPPISVNGRTFGEASTLMGEIKKKRRIRPIRKLFADIPNLIMGLKPCIMMSPLSVSTFLGDAAFTFDAVIFDEASQVRTEDALGAISRGKQVIIAGDSKQLPPTNFFQSNLDEGDEEAYEDAGAFESVLDEAVALPFITLKWHYRSRDESLISFSNAKIYDGNLVTFPSSLDAGDDFGVEFVHLPNAVYNGSRGGNPKEAEKVCDLIFEHFKKWRGTRSLGVIAFGDKQSTAIENALRRRRLIDQSFEEYFSEEAEHPFFVKNLENVQGDERDTIILSVGYGKGSDGILRLNFGPLSLAGGERRLNVAVTRAKYNLKVVSSIAASDIDSRRVSNAGPKLLKAYLDYAARGKLPIEDASGEAFGPEFNSSFEEAVYMGLVDAGYDVETQVGCSEYRIDLAVRHPSHPEYYLLGIECDGESYHSGRTARERERLRWAVLQNMGWQMHRTWSTDWAKDPKRGRRELGQTVADALASFDERMKVAHPIDRENQVSWADIIEGPEHAVSGSDYLEIDEERTKVQASAVVFEEYVVYERSAARDLSLDNYARHIIEAEYPIVDDEIMRRLMIAIDPQRTRLSEPMRRKVDPYLRLVRRDMVVEKAASGRTFYSPRGAQPRKPRVLGYRAIVDVAPSELASALLEAASVLVGVTKEDVIAATASALGIRRLSGTANEILGDVFDSLFIEGKLDLDDYFKVRVVGQ